MSQGISANPLNPLSQIYLSQIVEAKCDCEDCGCDPCVKCGESHHSVDEAVKGQDTESRREGAKERAAEKKSGKIKKNTLDSKEYAAQQKKSIEWHDKRTKGRYTPGQVSDVDEDSKYGYDKEGYSKNPAHKGKKVTKKEAQCEDFSDWRNDLREIVGSGSPDLISYPGGPKTSQEPGKSLQTTDVKNAKKVTEKKGIKNKIKINPEFKEAVEEIGGQLLEVKEVEKDDATAGNDALDNKEEKAKRKEQMLKKRIIRMKMMAVNQGADQGIIASYEPEIEGAVQYFYEQGINEEGLDQIIEEIGLDEFVDFVLDASEFLTEERPARKMNVRTLKATKKKAEEIKADKSDVVKRGTPLDTVRRARAERASKKPKLAKPAKPAVVKSVAKVKKTQPKKQPTKKGLRDRVSSAFKKGVERHKKAVGKNEFTKGVVSGVKSVGTFAKKVKGVLDANKSKTVNMQSYEPEGDTLSEVQVTRVGDEQHKAMQDAVLKRKEDLKKKEKEKVKEEVVDEGKLTSVKATTYGMPAKERQALIDKERERQGVKPKPTKEEVELQERPLDTFEKGEKERVVKGMKKDTKGFKKRYGSKWKSVMYATATKQAKEAGDTSKSDKRYAYEETDDRAFRNVVARLKAKHGDGVLSSKKDFDDYKKREAAKPKPKPKKDTRTPEQKKADQYKANMDAVYGGPQRDRGLGT